MKSAHPFAFIAGIASLMIVGAWAGEKEESPLRPGQTVEIRISGVSMETVVLSNTYSISESGALRLPYLDDIHAAGLRPSELQQKIETAYREGEIFTHPSILVSTAKAEVPAVVYVSGEVDRPNRIAITPGMTVMDGITSAGGVSDFGRHWWVIFTRAGVSRKLDLRKVDNPDAAIVLQPGDRIHVPK